MKNGCRNHQIGMDYLCDVIFKMDVSELVIFAYNSAFRVDRDEESNDDTDKSLWILYISEFKMAVIETIENHIFCHILTFKVSR